MDQRSLFNVPPRVGSAPLAQTQQVLQRVNRSQVGYRVGQLRAGGERQPPLPQQQKNEHSQQVTASSSTGIFDRTSQATATTSTASTAALTPEGGAGVFDSLVNSSPANCIYDITEFVKLQNTKDSPPAGVIAFVNELWKEMPENKSSRPEHLLSREELFQGESMPSKVMSERKLRNEVLGILGRVGEGNLERMKKELTDLPIRQSSNEEIEEVIQVIFHKSIQPEDSIFVPYYVKLVAHLISDIGDNETAGRFIRNAIIRQSQNMFEKAEATQGQLEREIVNLPQEEAELRRIIFAAKQKANINFLGLLFTHGLVRERVVLQILEWLLYGTERRRRIPADYELIHFMNLLVTCGKYFSKEGKEFVPKFRSVLEELMQTHPQRRIQFLLLNTLETIDNNWTPRYGAGATAAAAAGGAALSSSSPENDGDRRLPPSAPLRNKMTPSSPMNPIPSRDWFWGAMDKFFITSSVEEAVLLLADIPEETRIAYCSSVIHRYITTLRYTQQRARLGELFEELANKRVLPVEDVRKALFIHLHDAVEQDLFTEIPRYFYNWAVVVKGGRDVFPHSLHTDLINLLVESGTSRENIVNMVRDVHKVLNEGSNPVEADARYRFRVLPAVLRYSPPLLSGSAMDESEDILKQLREYDSDVAYFHNLCEQVDSRDVFMLTSSLGKAAHMSFSMISAFFTFVRFDVEALCREYKESVKKLATLKQLHLLLEEVYVTWQALDRTPENSFLLFVKALRTVNGTKDQIDKLKTILTKNYGHVGKKDALLLDKIK